MTHQQCFTKNDSPEMSYQQCFTNYDLPRMTHQQCFTNSANTGRLGPCSMERNGMDIFTSRHLVVRSSNCPSLSSLLSAHSLLLLLILFCFSTAFLHSVHSSSFFYGFCSFSVLVHFLLFHSVGSLHFLLHSLESSLLILFIFFSILFCCFILFIFFSILFCCFILFISILNTISLHTKFFLRNIIQTQPYR